MRALTTDGILDDLRHAPSFGIAWASNCEVLKVARGPSSAWREIMKMHILGSSKVHRLLELRSQISVIESSSAPPSRRGPALVVWSPFLVVVAVVVPVVGVEERVARG